MAGFNLNDTISMVMKILNNHQDIIRLWHEVTALLQKLGLITGAAPQAAHATHSFDVRWVQEALNQQIGAKLAVDGIMGPLTVEAVKKYQGARDLEPDGWIGVLTLAKLEQDMTKT